MQSSLTTVAQQPPVSNDQARVLRQLVTHSHGSMVAQQASTRNCHTIVVCGGKGGVGRSVIALNLAVLLSNRGGRVGLIDASPDFGNIELLCGLNGYWNLSHVYQRCRSLDDVILSGPAGIQVISGGGCLLANSAGSAECRFTAQLQKFEQQLDWLVIDASGNSSRRNLQFALAADDALIVTTPEPTAVAEAYASVKSFAAATRSRLGLLVNQANSAVQAQRILDHLQRAAHSFLQVDLHRRGYVPWDRIVPASVHEQCPFAMSEFDSPARLALTSLAQRWTRRNQQIGENSFFERLSESLVHN